MEVKSSIENVDEVTRKIKVTIPQERVKTEINSALDDVVRNANLKGFRQGKAPRDLVEKMHGERVRLEVANRLINTSLNELVKANNLDVIGNPEIDIASFEPGKEIEYTASVSLFPRPEIKNYQKFKVKVPKREIREDDIQDVLKGMLESKATQKKVEFRDTVKSGDIIDAMVSVESGDGKDNRPEPLVIAVGEGKLPKELDEGLIGLKIGESREITIKFPDDYREESMRGQETVYKVTLNSISEKVLPELSDDFAKSLQFGVETLLELRMKIRTQLEEELKRGGAADVHAAILEELIKGNSFQVPQVLIDDEIRNLLVRNGAAPRNTRDVSEINVEPFRESLGEMATKRVKTAIVVDRICELEKLHPTDADLDKALTEMAEKNGVTKEELRSFLIKEKMITGVMLEIMRTKTLDFLAEKAEVEYYEEKKEEAKE